MAERISSKWAMSARALTVSVGVTAAAALFAVPAHADSTSDAFLSALNSAGVGYGDPASAVDLGQQVCPMLSEPGGSFAKTASTVAGRDGIQADIAGLFTSIAISAYCPQMMTSMANGDFSQGTGILNSLGFIPGLSGLSGLAGQ
jgi:hypothetical protein